MKTPEQHAGLAAAYDAGGAYRRRGAHAEARRTTVRIEGAHADEIVGAVLDLAAERT